jgi:hypothetical protein
VPKREELDAFRVRSYRVVDVIANATEVKATNACQGNVPGTAPISGVKTEMSSEARSSSSRMALGLRRLARHQSWGGADLCQSELADVDASGRLTPGYDAPKIRSAMGVVWPFTGSPRDLGTSASVRTSSEFVE